MSQYQFLILVVIHALEDGNYFTGGERKEDPKASTLSGCVRKSTARFLQALRTVQTFCSA